jgi:hypothetical protein
VRHALQRQAVHGSRRIVTRDLYLARVDHGGHARDGQRRFRDVRGENDAAVCRLANGVVLRVAGQRTVQRHDLESRGRREAGEADSGPLDLTCSRKKAQHLPSRSRDQPSHRVGHCFAWRIFDCKRVERSRHLYHRTVAKKPRDAFNVERRRHDDQPKVISRQPRLPREGKADVGVHAPLVELVEDHRREIREQRILLQPRGEDSLRHHEQASVARGSAIETDMPPDFAAGGPPSLMCDAVRHRAGGHAPWLQENDGPCAEQRRRNARRLASAGCRRQHDGTARRQPAPELGNIRVDWQRVSHRSQIPNPTGQIATFKS